MVNYVLVDELSCHLLAFEARSLIFYSLLAEI